MQYNPFKALKQPSWPWHARVDAFLFGHTVDTTQFGHKIHGERSVGVFEYLLVAPALCKAGMNYFNNSALRTFFGISTLIFTFCLFLVGLPIRAVVAAVTYCLPAPESKGEVVLVPTHGGQGMVAVEVVEGNQGQEVENNQGKIDISIRYVDELLLIAKERDEAKKEGQSREPKTKEQFNKLNELAIGRAVEKLQAEDSSISSDNFFIVNKARGKKYANEELEKSEAGLGAK